MSRRAAAVKPNGKRDKEEERKQRCESALFINNDVITRKHTLMNRLLDVGWSRLLGGSEAAGLVSLI